MIEQVSSLWPCIGTAGLGVLAMTADQRCLLGEDIFLETHFPIALRRFYTDRPSAMINEAALLKWLLEQHTPPGNRVLVLYGAAGSGKSELIKWLQVMINRLDPARAEVTVHIPRTDLDTLSIAERFHHLLTQSYFDERMHRRWEEARRKPRTLARILLLTALEQCLNDDEQINALYYRLLDWVEQHIVHALTTTGKDTEISVPVELLSREDLARLREETALPVPLDYEQFRRHLLDAFRDHLLEGLNLPEALQLIVENVHRQKGMRPVLMIDDLVQSVNLFATDLLDYFITLENGNWDVIVGLTPGAMESDARGRELLDRITYLDTIDDRVEKLWLSDMEGHESYFLNEANCHEFAARYLAAYRARNGQKCEACPCHIRCAGLERDVTVPMLAPFNRAALRRMFRSLPGSKGKARYLLKGMYEALAAASNGEHPLDILPRYIQADMAVETDNEWLARAAMVYGPQVIERQELVLPSALLEALGLSSESITLRAEPLVCFPQHVSRLANWNENHSSHWDVDVDKTSIKEWLDGNAKSVDRQSLLTLRRGLARWLRAIYSTDALHTWGIAKPHSILRWACTHLATRPPIRLDNVDEYAGIPLSPAVGHAAFDLHRYARASGEEARLLAENLAQDERLLPTLFAAADYRRRAIAELEAQLGLSIAELALALCAVALVFADLPKQRPPGFGNAFWERVTTLRTRQGNIAFDKGMSGGLQDLFEDVFKLRDNVYDGPRIARLLDGRGPEDLLTLLTKIAVEKLDRDYWLGQERLSEALRKAISSAKQILARQPTQGAELLPAGESLWATLQAAGEQGISLNEVAIETLKELRDRNPERCRLLRLSLPHRV